ncbi:Uncharacterized protein B5E38_3635 [Bacillus cereus]|nr:Uncharacterized protein B5E38_3635 [Bacillus cereus]
MDVYGGGRGDVLVVDDVHVDLGGGDGHVDLGGDGVHDDHVDLDDDGVHDDRGGLDGDDGHDGHVDRKNLVDNHLLRLPQHLLPVQEILSVLLQRKMEMQLVHLLVLLPLLRQQMLGFQFALRLPMMEILLLMLEFQFVHRLLMWKNLQVFRPSSSEFHRILVVLLPLTSFVHNYPIHPRRNHVVHYCPSLSFLSPLLLNLAYLFYHISYRRIGVCLYWNSALLFVRSGIIENLN